MAAIFPDQYYNRFDANKRYKMLLFRAARGLQSAELNEIHSTLHNELSTIANAIFGDGSLLKGGQITRQGETANWTAAAATFYALGYTHQVPAATFTIAGTETVTYGIAIAADVVSENEDPALRDPALNTRNFNEPGAHRLRYTARWCKETEKTASESFYALAQFVDGARLSAAREAVESTATTDLIAKLDYASNGSYVINGLLVSNVGDDNDTQEHILNVESGTARVEGYERILDYSQRLRTSFALDTRTVNNEPQTFTTAGNYSLRWTPIAQLVEVNGIKEIVQSVTHGNFTGALDLLPNTPVVSVIAVNQGGTWDANTRAFVGGTTYSVGTDYVLNGDRIDWSPTGGLEPSPGSTYTVVYRYSAVITPTISTDRKSIAVTGLAPDTVFYVDYKHYIPRYDVVMMTRDGQLKVLKGLADYLNPVRPTVDTGLQLASVYVSYGSTPVVTSDFYRAYKFSDIFRLENAIIDAQYNIAKLSLNDNIRATDPTVTKRGTFVDPFFNDAQRDLGISQTAVTRNGVLAPDITWQVQQINSGNLVRLNSTEEVLIEQTAYTKTRKINGYASAALPPALTTISPNSIRWIDSTIFRDSWQTSWAWWSSTTVSITGTTDQVISSTIPQTTISITSSKFNANEPVQIYFDSTLVKTDNADAAGTLTTTFQTPVGARSGSKQVRVVGTVSGVEGSTIFEATAIQRTISRVITQFLQVWRIWDPLAQTFTTPDTRDYFLTSIDLQFSTAPAAGTDVEVSLVEVTLGLPNKERSLAVTRLPANQINTQIGTWTNFKFPNAVRIVAGVEYAFIVATTDLNAAIRVAEIGQYDPVAGRWISRQAYEAGVLLESSNQSTWTPLQREDATFRIKRASFIPSQTFNFTAGTAPSGTTDLMLLAGTDTQPDTSVRFVALLPNAQNALYNLVPYQPTIIPTYNGPVNVSATLSTASNTVSPTVDGDVSLAFGTLVLPATYVTRAIPVPAGSTGIKVFLDILEPSAASVVVQYRNAADTAWVTVPRDSAAGVSVGDNWVEMPFNVSIPGLTSTRIRISMNTSDPTQRPAARNLRLFFI